MVGPPYRANTPTASRSTSLRQLPRLVNFHRSLFAVIALTLFPCTGWSLAKDTCKENGGSYNCASPVASRYWRSYSDISISNQADQGNGVLAKPECFGRRFTKEVREATADAVVDKVVAHVRETHDLCLDRSFTTHFFRAESCDTSADNFASYWTPDASGSLISGMMFYRPLDWVFARRWVYGPFKYKTCDVKYRLDSRPGEEFVWDKGLALKDMTCPFGQLYGNGQDDPFVCIEGTPTAEELGQGDCTKNEGNPINSSTGNKYQVEVDYQHPRGLLSLKRHFNSMGQSEGINFGAQWRDDYGRSLEVRIGTASTIVNAYRGDGRLIPFTKSGAAYIAASTIKDKLTEQIDGVGNTTGWRYYDVAAGTIETYDSALRLRVIARADSYSVTLSYDADGMLQRVQDTFGAEITFVRDPNSSQVVSATVPTGIYRYGYDSRNRLTSVTYPDDRTRGYDYSDDPSLLVGINDENGKRFATFGYFNSQVIQEAQRGVSTEHAGGVERFTLDYADYPNSIAVTDPLGTRRVKKFGYSFGSLLLLEQSQPAGAGCLASTSYIRYDAGARPEAKHDFNGNLVCYEHNVRSLETRRMEGADPSQSCDRNFTNSVMAANARQISTDWHPDWAFPKQVAEPYKLTTYVYNGQPDPFNSNSTANCAPSGAVLPDGKPIAVLCKRVEQATTDANGQQKLAPTLADVAVTPMRVWSWTYDIYGQRLTSKDPTNGTTSYAYHATSTADYRIGDLSTMTNAVGHVVKYGKYNADGQQISTTDPRGVETTYAYDARGRVRQISSQGRVTDIVYDPAGLIRNVGLPDGSSISYSYDDAHRLTGVTDQRGNSITYTLDNAGNRIREDHADPGGTLARSITRVYDALGRLQLVGGASQ